MNKAMAEVQARKCTLAMTTTIIQRSNEIFSLARERAEEVIANEVLGNATFVTTLLPLVMAHISPLATSDPRVSNSENFLNYFSNIFDIKIVFIFFRVAYKYSL